MMRPRHFLALPDLSRQELTALIDRAIALKAIQRRGELHEPLRNRTLAMIFDKSSTRTRVSFEAGMTQLGGNSMFLSPNDTQLGRGEPIEDTARVISRMVDVIVIRTFEHEKVERFARHSQVPVINALTDRFHPCQLLADIQTFVERQGDMTGKTAAWIGDGNNMCHTWMHAAKLLDFRLKIATPAGYGPDPALVRECADHVELTQEPERAVANADVVITDTWASMGQENEKAEREKAFARFMVNEKLMRQAAPGAIFMHCLPAYRGAEVSAGVLDGPQSVVWDEAENRLHAQKALLEFLLDRTR